MAVLGGAGGGDTPPGQLRAGVRLAGARAAASGPGGQTPDGADARRALLDRAARALGIATADDLRDYYRIPAADAPGAIEQLVEEGTLVRCACTAGGRRPICTRMRAPVANRRRGAVLAVRPAGLASAPHGAAVRLSLPARNLHAGAQARARLLRAAVPVDGALVARVDLKADRKPGALIVLGTHVEPGAPPDVRAGSATSFG